jgi:hypothetical protein
LRVRLRDASRPRAGALLLVRLARRQRSRAHAAGRRRARPRWQPQAPVVRAPARRNCAGGTHAARQRCVRALVPALSPAKALTR